MDKEVFSALIKKYLKGEATSAEQQFLEAYYEDLHTGQPIDTLLSENQISNLEIEMFSNIQSALKIPKVKQISIYQQYKNYAAVAASLLLFSMAGLVFHYQSKNKGRYISTYAKAGGVLRMELSDGTLVWLNSKSKLTYPQSFKNKANREIFLVGEAYFEVKKDKVHPFLVHTQNLTTRVLGTKFNISAYNGTKSIEVTLVEGKVMLTTDAKIAKITDKKPDTLFLKPNEKAIFQSGILQNKFYHAETEAKLTLTVKPDDKNNNGLPGKGILSKRTVPDAAIASSWRNGELIFNNEPLENVLASLNGKYDVVIKAAPELLNYPVSGKFDGLSIDDIVLNITNQIKSKALKGDVSSERNVQYKKSGSDYYIE